LEHEIMIEPLDSHPRRISRRAFVTALALSIGAVASAGVALLRDRASTEVVLSPNGSATTAATPPPASAERWAALPASKLSARAGHVTVWTGTELLVWSGWDDKHEIEGLNSGAAYDPAKATWRTISPAPIAPRGRPVIVWTGKEVLIYGGVLYEGTIGDGAAYRPSTDSWRKLPASPLGARAGTAYAWTGKQLLIWGGSSGYDMPITHGDGMAFDPNTNRWTAMGAAPIEARFGPAFAWSGSELLVWGGSGRIIEGEEGSYPEHLTNGAAYDPETESWRSLPPSSIQGRAGQASFWTGTEMLVVGGHRWDTGQNVALQDAAAFDPATSMWRSFAFPIGERQDYPIAWTGRELVVWGGYLMTTEVDEFRVVALDDGIAVDAKDGSVRTLPEAPVGARYGHSMTWVGDRLILWGGIDGSDAGGMLADGAVYFPA
jgi:N-acetylneuraminic acid mutarotase